MYCWFLQLVSKPVCIPTLAVIRLLNVQGTAQHFIFMDDYRFAIEKIGFKHILHAHNWLSALFLDKEGQTN